MGLSWMIEAVKHGVAWSDFCAMWRTRRQVRMISSDNPQSPFPGTSLGAGRGRIEWPPDHGDVDDDGVHSLGKFLEAEVLTVRPGRLDF